MNCDYRTQFYKALITIITRGPGELLSQGLKRRLILQPSNASLACRLSVWCTHGYGPLSASQIYSDCLDYARQPARVSTAGRSPGRLRGNQI